MGDMEIPDELIDQLLGEYQGPEQLTGPDGLINQLRKRLIERAAGAELEQHLGYSPGAEAPEGQPNRRNGLSAKTLRTVDGPVTVELPRDRDASFEPRIVPKHGRSFDGFDDQILALYAGGMTTREIQRHLGELYGVDVSDGLISEVTALIQDDVRAWQGRPLEELYVVVYLDALQVAIRDQQVVRKKAVYVAVGVTLEGTRDCLGLWIEKTEGAPARRSRGSFRHITLAHTSSWAGSAVFGFPMRFEAIRQDFSQHSICWRYRKRSNYAGPRARCPTGSLLDVAGGLAGVRR